MDPRTLKQKNNKLRDLAKIERGIQKSVRRAQNKAALIVPKEAQRSPPVGYPPPEPITAEVWARRSWREPGEHRTISVTTLCRAIALNEAQRILKAEGLTHCVILDVYEGPPLFCN